MIDLESYLIKPSDKQALASKVEVRYDYSAQCSIVSQ